MLHFFEFLGFTAINLPLRSIMKVASRLYSNKALCATSFWIIFFKISGVNVSMKTPPFE